MAERQEGTVEERSAIRLKQEDVLFLNRQIASMARLNMPIAKGLRVLARDVQDPAFKAVIEAIQQDLDEGRGLQEALARHPETFSKLHLEIVKAGEQTGNLAVILEELNAHTEAMRRIRSRILEAVTYPAVISVAMALFVMFFLSYVAPNFEQMVRLQVESRGESLDTLPRITRALFALSDLAQNAFVLVLVSAGAVAVGVWGWRTMARMGEEYDQFMFTLPVFGSLFREAALMKVTRTMRDLLTHGVSMVETLRLSSSTVGRNAIQAKLDDLRSAVEEGGSFSLNLAEGGVFPEAMVWKLQLAEEKGIIEDALNELSQEFEAKVDQRTTLITKLLAPVLLFAMGGVVLLGFLACMLPLTQFSAMPV